MIAIDIGNTSTSIGYFSEKKLVKKRIIKTSDLFKNAKALVKDNVMVISSVVPRVTKRLRTLFPKAIFVKARNIKGIKVMVKKPGQVGPDRVINALSAKIRYGQPVVVIDFGTATTFDIVSKNGDYIGGVILPGLDMNLEALHGNTAMLPLVSLSHPKGIIGKNTKGAILTGVVHGYRFMIEGFIRKFRKILGNSVKFVLTGGRGRFMKKYFRKMIFDPDITLYGLHLFYKGVNDGFRTK
jgi:type III pantothenate kinase